jgi:glycosyltransferase involved in cell wall biosynthesis
MKHRLLLVIKGLGRGGAERLLVDTVSCIDRDAFDVEVAYVLPAKRALVPELVANGVAVTCLSEDGRAWPLTLSSLVRARGFDLIHAHSPICGVAVRMLPGLNGAGIVYTEHNVWPRYHALTRWANIATFARNDRVFTVSEEVTASIRRAFVSNWLRMPSVETLHHGLPPDFEERWSDVGDVRTQLGIPEGVPLVVTVANFKAHKGHEFLLRAAVQVRRAVPEVRFVLVGVGPLESSIRKLAAELELDGTVVFAGFRDDAPRLMLAGDVFVLPSEREGLPVALLEAMALARAPIVTPVGGVPEVVRDGREALFVRPRDAPALADAISWLLARPSDRARLGEAARLRVKRYDIRNAARRMESVYKELV